MINITVDYIVPGRPKGLIPLSYLNKDGGTVIMFYYNRETLALLYPRYNTGEIEYRLRFNNGCTNTCPDAVLEWLITVMDRDFNVGLTMAIPDDEFEELTSFVFQKVYNRPGVAVAELEHDTNWDKPKNVIVTHVRDTNSKWNLLYFQNTEPVALLKYPTEEDQVFYILDNGRIKEFVHRWLMDSVLPAYAQGQAMMRPVTEEEFDAVLTELNNNVFQLQSQNFRRNV